MDPERQLLDISSSLTLEEVTTYLALGNRFDPKAKLVVMFLWTGEPVT